MYKEGDFYIGNDHFFGYRFFFAVIIGINVVPKLDENSEIDSHIC